MTKPLLIFCGRVTKLANVTPQKANAKLYLSVKIEGPAETFNGKEFRSRVEAKVYYGADELAKTLREGMLVSCHGNARAEHFEWNGKHYASLICERATVTILDDVGAESEPKVARTTQTTPSLPLKPATAGVNQWSDGEDDVPF